MGITFFGGGEPAVEGAAAVEEGEDAGAGGGGEGRCWELVSHMDGGLMIIAVSKYVIGRWNGNRIHTI